MIIKSVKTYIVSQKLGEKSFCYSQAWYNSRTILLVEIVTDDGLSGWGEAFGNAYINKAVIDHCYAGILYDQNVFDSTKIWNELYNALRDNGQKGSCIQALSAVDNALWDLKGKYTHLPVYRLMGGSHRDRIIPYATGLYHSKSEKLEKELIEEAEGFVERGFRAMKMKIGFGVEKDIYMVKKIRAAIGNKIELMVDANHAYNAMTAIKIAKAIEEYDIAWFEEPVPPEDLLGYQEVKEATFIPISGGEAEFTAYGFDSFIRGRAVDILQPDCCVTGGLSEFIKICTLAKIGNIQVYPHVWGSAVALQVGIQAAFSAPHFPESLNPAPMYLELDRTENIFREKLNKKELRIVDGYVYQQDLEGLGLDIDREIIDLYRIG